ncbi:MAG: hypothetical protein L6R43_05115, partial [Planctomycetes bacterium]|nr:hypothetical protein [Planctomycetota bacterium]
MIARCPSCGTGLDITGIPPGNAVACGACGKPFWIAAGVAPAAAPPVVPPTVPPQGRGPAPASRP